MAKTQLKNQIDMQLTEHEVNLILMMCDASAMSAGFFKGLSEKVFVLPGELGESNSRGSDAFIGAMRAIAQKMQQAVIAAKKKENAASGIILPKDYTN